MLLRGEQDALHKQTSLRTTAASERWRAHRSGHTSGSISSPLSLPGREPPNQKQQLSRGTQGGQDTGSSARYPQFNTFTLNLSLHQPHEARSKIPEAREEKELPAALHGLTARLQPSSLQAPPVPQAHYNCSVPVVFSGYTSSWAQCSCGRRKGIFFSPKTCTHRTGGFLAKAAPAAGS